MTNAERAALTMAANDRDGRVAAVFCVGGVRHREGWTLDDTLQSLTRLGHLTFVGPRSPSPGVKSYVYQITDAGRAAVAA